MGMKNEQRELGPKQFSDRDGKNTNIKYTWWKQDV